MDTRTRTVVTDALKEELRVAEQELEEVKRSAARVPTVQAEVDHLRATLERLLKGITQDQPFKLTPPAKDLPDPVKVEEAVNHISASVNGNNPEVKRGKGSHGGRPRPGSIGDTIIDLLKGHQEPIYITDIHSLVGVEKVKYESLASTLASYTKRGWLVRTAEGYYTVPKTMGT